MLMAGLRILIPPTSTSRLVCNCFKASSRALRSRTTLPHRNHKMFTPRLTRRLVSVRLPLLSGVPQLPRAQLCRAPLLLGRSRIGIGASMSCSRRARLLPLMVLTSATVFELLEDPRRPALIKSLAELSPTLLAVELLCARLRRVLRVVTLLLTLCLSWRTPPPLVTHVLPVAAMVEEGLFPLRMLALLPLVVPTVARPVLVLPRLIIVRSRLPLRSAQSVTSAPHPQSLRTHTSSSTPVLALLHQLAMRQASLRVLPRPLRRQPPPRPPPVSVARIVLPLR